MLHMYYKNVQSMKKMSNTMNFIPKIQINIIFSLNVPHIYTYKFKTFEAFGKYNKLVIATDTGFRLSNKNILDIE